MMKRYKLAVLSVLTLLVLNMPLAAQKRARVIPQPHVLEEQFAHGGIVWEQFVANNEQESVRIKTISNLLNQIAATDTNLDSQFSLQQQAGTPTYDNLPENVKYIYIGEHHGVASMQDEVQTILHKIRQKYPNKKILLATEFVKLRNPSKSPLLTDPQPQWREYLKPSYGFIKQTAFELSMDVLALEEDISEFSVEKNHILVKVGDQIIKINPALPQVQNLLQPFDTGTEGSIVRCKKLATHATLPFDNALYQNCLGQDHTFNLQQVIKISDWGTDQRTKYWHTLLQKFQDNYDLIIVWGGAAHITGVPSTIVDLMNQPAVVITFEPINNNLQVNNQDVLDLMGQAYNQAGMQFTYIKPSAQRQEQEAQAWASLPAVDETAPHFRLKTRKAQMGVVDPAVEGLQQRLNQVAGLDSHAQSPIQQHYIIYLP
ncbi:MAG: hypothetical protein J6X06_04000 [Elusimicrobiaceae bacterium]|nr:hypothetical protein [Elusimicrobiaceae bacterium]